MITTALVPDFWNTLYVKILNDSLLLDAKSIFGNSTWTLIQDNDPKHTSSKVQEFLVNNEINFVNQMNGNQILQTAT